MLEKTIKNKSTTVKAEVNEDIRREWMTEKEAAAYLKCSKKNLETLRLYGRVVKNGVCERPPVFPFGGSVRYERHELDKWLLSQRI